MTPRLALSIAPLLMFALSHQAEAQVTLHKPAQYQHQSSARKRLASLGGRHNRHIGFRHLAVRHVEGRHVAQTSDTYGVAETNGWNAAEAGISAPAAASPIAAAGATVGVSAGSRALRLASDAAPAESQQGVQPDSQSGVASFYGGHHNGRRTSSGRIFNEHEMTAAHATLPFGTKVLVKLAGTDRSVVVTITDRLYEPHRIIDLSEGAAQRLGILREGLAMVMLTPEN